MKDVIRQKLRESLNELGTKPKPTFKSGVEHQLYTSPNKPDVLFKVGNKDNVLKWSNVFKSNPKLFPRVYKVGQLKDGKCYVEIEKLNTDKAVIDWNTMEQALEQIGAVDTDVFEDTIDQLFINLVLGYVDFNNIYKRLGFNKHVQDLFGKWVTFLKKTYQYIKKFSYKGLDIHRYNFAYDSAGNMKAIDI
jgi:hypothetical protein